MAKVFIHIEDYNLPEELMVKRQTAEENWGKILTENIDFSKFREDLPKETTFNFIRWTIEGYRTELEQRIKMQGLKNLDNQSFDPYYKEFYDYLDILKRIYYKPDYINK